MVLLNWYSFSATGFWNWLGNMFDRSFHLLQRFGAGPDIFYVTLLCVLFLIWMGMMRQYDSKAKDKGLID